MLLLMDNANGNRIAQLVQRIAGEAVDNLQRVRPGAPVKIAAALPPPPATASIAR